MAKDFEVGQKAYLCFNKDGTITDPVPSLVFHSKLQYYKEYLLPKLEVKIKKVKKKIRDLEK